MIITIFGEIIKGAKNAFQRRILKKYSIEPMMKQREKRIFEEIITNLKPKNILEWGSGYSTLYFPKLISETSNWTAIEHNKEWYNILKPQNKRNNVSIELIKHNPNWKDNDIDGTYNDFKEYIEYPLKLKKKFELIIVDGRSRRNCLEATKKLLTKNGIVILHDANRDYYYKNLNLYENKILFKDSSINHGGIMILSNNPNFKKLLNISKHKKIWKEYNKLSKIPLLGKIIIKIS